MARYECSLCGYAYDEDQEGVRWDALPPEWVCPGCGSDRSLFNRMDDAASATQDAPALAKSDVLTAPAARNTAVEPTLELIHALARDGLEKTGHHGPLVAMGVPRPTLPQWDDIQILPAQLAKKPLAEDVEVRHRTGDRSQCQEASSAGDPDLRFRHELRSPVRGGQDRLVQRCPDGGDGHLLGRRRDAAGRERRQLPLSLRVGIGEVRLLRRPSPESPGVSLQGGAGGQDRDRRPSARQQGQGEDRRSPQAARGPTGDLAADILRPDHARGLPAVRRPCACS